MLSMKNGDNFVKSSKELQHYLHSDENKLICRPYMLECQRFSEIALLYSNKCHLIFNSLNSNTVCYAYSVGGEALHRGYYCPSPILDIVVGNCSRGKLLKRVTEKSKPTYRYGYDSNNEIITVDQIYLDSNEIIVRQGQIETGILFTKDFGINTLSECIYNGKQLTSYAFCLYSAYEKRVVEYRKEEYQYSAAGLDKANSFIFLNDKKAPILQHEQYHFQHDSEGYLSRYTVIHYEGELIKPSVWDGHVFDVKIRRKV